LSAPLTALGDVVEPAGGLGIDLPDHAEIGVRIDRSVLGREVADMAERGHHLVGGAQILVDRLGLRRRTATQRLGTMTSRRALFILSILSNLVTFNCIFPEARS
jgi:hypothetical protein